ncbi:aromatic ring-hydroxylating dioxygenase subunit alpha [Geitlerinema sp. PCC 9228]|jgi:phenylpropionate dioxygenase-like ring-hydroxylating dioxygenase large terminal subunit|uniref:aromatic ring-hydroxylating dioxygenase subunit alpha n=1 Tax=Geitlerinema sp. PCC 9228 TaxID=111611 RepID=UPI0008F9DF8A|nr:aromatic ring-hydroxylating dioxygenase subunit alpha [Geitlerinema sp. PCC 9228]
MESAAKLTSQQLQNTVRQVGINPNYWYPVEWASTLKPGEVHAVTLWQEAIALYRDIDGTIHALEDACPHKGVALHKGEVNGKNLVCRYHGWEFNGDGECVNIPYFPPEQKLPCAQARSYPVQEQYGLIWIFPGDPNLASQSELPHIKEYDDPSLLCVPIPSHFPAHFSICNENTMDVFHGFLHKDLQGWFNPKLLSLQETENGVSADYQVSYKGLMPKLLGLSASANEVTTRTITLEYQYPHYRSSLEGLSSLYLLRCPRNWRDTRSFSYLFLRLPLPKWVVSKFGKWLAPLIRRFLFEKFLAQDREMVASEQKTYDANPQRKYVEVNPAILALQRAIVRKYQQDAK